MTAVDRGTKLSRAQESLERTKDALERNRGKLTEQDWVEAVERAERVVERELAASLPLALRMGGSQ